MFNKVFISYASEDFDYADKLYDYLRTLDYDPWMDKRELVPGQQWEFHIQKALQQSDFIILLLSKVSVTKRGYVQKEFKQALRYCEEKLDSDIYIIPIKLDACEVPMTLSKFQWIEYSSANAFERVYQSLSHQRSQRLSEHQRLHEETGISFKILSIKGTLGILLPKQIYEIEYPQFDNPENESLVELNSVFSFHAVKTVLEARGSYYDYLELLSDEERSNAIQSDHSVYVRLDFGLLNKKMVSYISHETSYSGGAHGLYGSFGHNYLLSPLRELNFSMLFENYNEALKILREIVLKKLVTIGMDQYGNEDLYFVKMFEQLNAKHDDFKNHYFTNKSIVFIYNPYHLTPWMMGSQIVEVDFEELKQNFPNQGRLINLIDSIAG